MKVLLRLSVVFAFICIVLGPATASARMLPYNEPAYTKTSGTDYFWWQYQAVDGRTFNPTTNQIVPDYRWYFCLTTKVNGVTVETSNGQAGPNSPKLHPGPHRFEQSKPRIRKRVHLSVHHLD